MDAIRSAGRAIIRSPIIAKRSWNTGKHKELPENWTDITETVVDGMTFNLRHLGMTLVDQPKGEDLSAAAVKRIVATAKAGGQKPLKMSLKVSPQGLMLYDRLTNQLLDNISIYRISYCTADKLHDKVFAYISQNPLNGTLECHAYLCPKRKVAQAVTLTVAQAFRVAFELWQVAKEEEEEKMKSSSAGEATNSSQLERSNSLPSLKGGNVATGNLLDLEELTHVAVVLETNGNEEFKVDNHTAPENNDNNNTVWEIEEDLDEAFSSPRLNTYESSPDWRYPVLTPRSWTLG
ncbi:low density lipoprotein receptor adapter protein 1a isoform X2 [Oncorhynchus tshawytscha]|uniref:low density lipoprotein receptor adapter protein 1a isoform X2 n=1 Tax=Oncorhynchus tshawytscha TaxID=74940 RepID=UPI001C3C8830|nr:low density lipoprotein receptor adapter protein 1a isoform X2 [Oncorhynchus tshawytscha]